MDNMDNSSSTVSSFNKQANQGLKELAKVLPIAIAIILTNGLVFLMFFKRKSLRNSSNYFLLGLAVCDFLTGAVNIPYFIIFTFGVVPMTSPMFKPFAFWLYALQTLMGVSAAYHILIITAEKYLAIVQPLRHHLVCKKTVFKILAGIWLASGFIAIIPLAWRNAQSRFAYIIHAAACLVIVFLVPYVFMVYAYIVMFKAVSGRKRPSHRKGLRLQKNNRTDRKCILVFAFMAVIYLLCWFPYFTLMLILNIKKYNNSYDGATDIIEKPLEVFAIIRFITSVTNPLLYTFFKRDFLRALRDLSVRRKSRFGAKRTSTVRSFSLRYFSVERRSTSVHSSRSVASTTHSLTRVSLTARNPYTEVDEQSNEQYVCFVSSV